MKVTVKLFARAREVAGAAEVRVELPEGATVGALRERLRAEFPRLAGLLPRCVVAVQEGDEVALIPPVSGG
jgi:molybdopterin synthase catalytic subunit/molybdopterin synthase sulfur carrier subunit